MEERLLQQLKRGVLEMLVLGLVSEAPTYGYELLSKLKERSGGLFVLKEGTLYPIFYRLEDDGMIEASWSAGEGRTAPKKIYTVTADGREGLKTQQRIWRGFSAAVERFLEGENEDEHE